MNKEIGFQMWFVLQEKRIRKLRDKYEKDNKESVGIKDFAEWLRKVADTDELYDLKQN
jgi:hypothetical protein